MIDYVQAGACVPSGGAPGVSGMAISCALEREDCEGAIFRSSRELILGGSEARGYFCLERTIDTRIGRCKGDPTFSCTGNAESCLDQSGFYPFADDCSMLVDKSPQRLQNRALFGGCTETTAPFPTNCYWSEADCDPAARDDIQWVPAGLNTICTCEETLTGACLNNGNYYCAVSELGCDNESIFVPAPQLPQGVTCFLCEQQDGYVIEMKSSQMTEKQQDQYPTEPPQDRPTISPESDIPTAMQTLRPENTGATVAPNEHRYFEQDYDYRFLYIAIPVVLTVNLLMCLIFTCTGSNSPKQLDVKRASNEEDIVANPTGELA